MVEKIEVNWLDENSEMSELEKSMAKGYIEMGDINLQICEEMRHLESEAEHTTNKLLRGD